MANKRSFVDGAVRKEQICDAAKRLFAARGYHATSVRDIAAQLDLQGGSLYSHIDAKEDLLWALVDRAADSFISRAAAVAARFPDPTERLQALVRAHVEYMASDLDNAVVFHHEWRFLAPARRLAIAHRRHEYEDYFRQAIHEGVSRDVFLPQDERFATLLVMSLVNWFYQWYRPDGPLPADAIAGRFNELILRALGAPAPIGKGKSI